MVKDNQYRSDAASTFDRRTFLQASSGALAGMAATGLVSADDGDHRVEGDVPYPDHSKLLVDDSLTSLTPQYDLLTLDKKRLLDLTEKAGMREQGETEAKDALKDLWRTYPVRKVRDGDDFVFTLAEDRAKASTAAEEKTERFGVAARAVGRGFAKENGNRKQVDAQWYGSMHREMTRHTVENEFDLYSWEEDDIVGASPTPDSNPCNDCGPVVESADWPDWVKDAIKKGLNEFAHHYGHYYDPNQYTVDLGYGVTISFEGLGGAPWFCEHEMGLAEENSYTSQREHLGRALHYVQDVSVPLHSGMGLEQMNLELDCDWSGCGVIDPYYDLHYSYEEWVKNNFTSGENFVDDYDSMLAWNGDPSDCVYEVAESGNSYSYEVFHLVKENGTDFGSWNSTDYNDLVEATANPISHAGGYTHALIDQIYG